jgi:hypothetical protein
MNLPNISSYGNYSSDNSGAHCLKVNIGEMTLFFSYQTLVAFSTRKTGLVCRENDWGPTTGKHLNIIQPDKKKRVDTKEFEKLCLENNIASN